jgi:hypothetical protein
VSGRRAYLTLPRAPPALRTIDRPPLSPPCVHSGRRLPGSRRAPRVRPGSAASARQRRSPRPPSCRTARCGRRASCPDASPLGCQPALFLGQRGINVQHKWIGIGFEFGDDERGPVLHQAADEMHVAGQTIELCDDNRAALVDPAGGPERERIIFSAGILVSSSRTWRAVATAPSAGAALSACASSWSLRAYSSISSFMRLIWNNKSAPCLSIGR